MKLLEKFFLISLLLITSACTSAPIRSLSDTNKQNHTIQLSSVVIAGCIEAMDDKLHGQKACEYELNKFKNKLKETNLFKKISVGKDESAEYVIKLKPYYQRPYYASIYHNPGFLLLSIAVPFWEDIKYGDAFFIQSRTTNKEFYINNIDEGVSLMWSGSMLINLLPNRGLPGSHDQSEIEYLKNSIIKSLEGNTGNGVKTAI